jgi:hypothetical protein
MRDWDGASGGPLVVVDGGRERQMNDRRFPITLREPNWSPPLSIVQSTNVSPRFGGYHLGRCSAPRLDGGELMDREHVVVEACGNVLCSKL